MKTKTAEGKRMETNQSASASQLFPSVLLVFCFHLSFLILCRMEIHGGGKAKERTAWKDEKQNLAKRPSATASFPSCLVADDFVFPFGRPISFARPRAQVRTHLSF